MTTSITSTSGATPSSLTDPYDKNKNDKDNTNQAPDTASQIEALRKVEKVLSKQLKSAVRASSTDPAAQAMVASLTAQITSLEADINNIVGLSAMSPTQKISTSSSNANAMNTKTLQEHSASAVGEMSDGKSSADDGASVRKGNTVRLDMKGTFVDEVA